MSNNNWGPPDPNKKAVKDLIATIRNLDTGSAIEPIKELISKISNLNQVVDGTTALIEASKRGFYNIVEALIDNGASLDVQDSRGETALMVVSKIQYRPDVHLPILELLLERGANINIQDTKGQTALISIYDTGLHSYDFVARLLEHGADTTIQDYKGKTALMYATEKATSEDDLLLLLDYIKDINLQDKKGKTALMYATEMGHIIAVILLLKYGADKDIRNNAGQTARDIAINRPDIVDVIDNYLLLRNTTTAKALNTIFNIQTKKAYNAKKELPPTLSKDAMSIVGSFLSGVPGTSLNKQLPILQNKMYGTYIPPPHGPNLRLPRNTPKEVTYEKETGNARRNAFKKGVPFNEEKSSSSGGRRTKRHAKSKPTKKHRRHRAITKRRAN